jgi:hypothetical protein
VGEATAHSYPLKTSLEKGQLFRSLPFAVNASFQVAFTRSVNSWFHLTLVATILFYVKWAVQSWLGWWCTRLMRPELEALMVCMGLCNCTYTRSGIERVAAGQLLALLIFSAVVMQLCLRDKLHCIVNEVI